MSGENPTGNKVEQALLEANAIMAQFVPLIGVVGTTATLLVALAKKLGVDTKAFEDELANLDAQRAGLRSALDEFRAKYPATASPDAAPGGTISGGAPSARTQAGPPATAGARTPVGPSPAKDAGKGSGA
jgi:hypothetical protein